MPDKGFNSFRIRAATAADAAEIAAIYASEVAGGTATFEFDAPDAVEMASRIATVQENGYPFIVALDADGGVGGYAYLSAFRTRPAFKATAENSVYVSHRLRGRGAGRALLVALIAEARSAGNIHRIIAVIGDPDTQAASVKLHAAAGFINAGRLTETGRKFGHWLDIVLMELAL